MKADGTVYVDTAIDVDGFKSGSRDLETAAKNMASKVEGMGKKVEIAVQKSINAFVKQNQAVSQQQEKVKDLQQQLQELEGQKTETDAYKAVNADIAKLETSLDKAIEKQVKFMETGGKEGSRTFQKMEYDIAELTAKLEEARKQKQSLESSGAAYTPVDTSALDSKLASETGKLANMNSRLSTSFDSLKLKVDGYKKSIPIAESKNFLGVIGSLIVKIGTLAGKLVSVSAKMTFSAAKKGISAILSGLKSCVSSIGKMVIGGKSASKSFGGLGATIKRLAPALLAARGVMGILRKAVDAYMQQNQQLANTLSGAWTGLGNLLGPIITRIVNLVATAIAYVTRFLGLLGMTGKSAKKEMSGAGSAAKKAGEEAKKAILPFDELTTLGDEQSDSGGGGGGAGAEAFVPEVTLPDWAQLMAEQLKAGKWAEAASTLATALNGMVDSVDWAGIGGKIGEKLDGAMTFLATAIQTFDWFGVGANLAESINNIVSSVDWSNLGVILAGKFKIAIDFLSGILLNLDMVELAKAASNIVIGFFDSISETIQSIDWYAIGEQIKTFLVNVDWVGVAESVFTAIGSAFGAVAGLLWGLIKDAWSNVVSWWKDTAYEDGEFTIEGLLNGIWEKIKDIGSWIKEHIFNPFIDGFKSAFGIHSPSTVMAEQGGYIIDGLLNGIRSAWTSVKDWIGNALSDIRSAFADAWNAVRTTTENIWNGIVSGIKGAVNNVIGVINRMISTVCNGWNALANLFSFNIPGIGNIGLPKIQSAPQIPYLAKGAVIPPKSPFMAVLGDQRHGNNIEAPEDLIRKIVREEAGNAAVEWFLNVSFDGDLAQFARIITPKITAQQRKTERALGV